MSPDNKGPRFDIAVLPFARTWQYNLQYTLISTMAVQYHYMIRETEFAKKVGLEITQSIILTWMIYQYSKFSALSQQQFRGLRPV